MMPTGIEIRTAGPADAGVVFDFICELARYEREPDAVEVDVATLEAQMSAERPPFECLIAEIDRAPIGFALFFENYSTWKGRIGVHLEDLFVTEAHRGLGAGRAMLSALSQITLERGGARLEWQVLDWNEPSIRFYESIGAAVMREWLPCRLSGEALSAMAAPLR